jgi:hypothetical protein
MKLEVNVDNLSKNEDDNISKVGDLDATAMVSSFNFRI